MKTTPSLRNLNEDPLMSDSLVYFLKPGVTAFGCQKENEDEDAAEEYEDETEYSVRLYGAGMMPKHCQLSYDPADGGANRVLELIAQKGVVFVNGKQVEDGTVTALKHNDRIIMGNSQVFKVNDPVNAPVGGGPKQLIDWDLAQNELQEAMGTTGRVSDGAPHIHAQLRTVAHPPAPPSTGTMVQLKVDEEVAKKKAELEAKLAEMEARFAAENDAMRMELEEKTSMGAADQVTGRHDCHRHALHHHLHFHLTTSHLPPTGAPRRDGGPQEGDRRLPGARHPPRQRVPPRAHPAGDRA